MPDVPDLTDFEQATGRAPGCGMVPFLAELDDTQRTKVLAAMDVPVSHISHAAIRKVCLGWGCEQVPSAGVIGNHRNGACSCPRVDRD